MWPFKMLFKLIRLIGKSISWIMLLLAFLTAYLFMKAVMDMGFGNIFNP